MNYEHRKQLQTIIEKGTRSTVTSIKGEDLDALKELCRHSDDNMEVLFEILKVKLSAPHPQTRLLAVLLVNYFFERSHVFRSLMMDFLTKFMDLTLGTARTAVPPPRATANYLREKTLEYIEAWNDKFGPSYKVLRLGYRYLKHTMQMQFPNLRAVREAQQQLEDDREARRQRLLRTRYERIVKSFPSISKKAVKLMDSMDQCFDTLFEDKLFDDMSDTEGEQKSSSVSKTDGSSSSSAKTKSLVASPSSSARNPSAMEDDDEDDSEEEDDDDAIEWELPPLPPLAAEDIMLDDFPVDPQSAARELLEKQSQTSSSHTASAATETSTSSSSSKKRKAEGEHKDSTISGKRSKTEVSDGQAQPSSSTSTKSQTSSLPSSTSSRSSTNTAASALPKSSSRRVAPSGKGLDLKHLEQSSTNTLADASSKSISRKSKAYEKGNDMDDEDSDDSDSESSDDDVPLLQMKPSSTSSNFRNSSSSSSGLSNTHSSSSEGFASPRARAAASSSSNSSPNPSSDFPSLPMPPLAPQISQASASSVDSGSAPHPPSLDEMIRRHALGSRAYRLNVAFADGVAHLETKENEALLASIRKSAKALNERFLPVFNDFSNVVTKVDINHGVRRSDDDLRANRQHRERLATKERLVREIINTRSRLRALLEKCKDLKLWTPSSESSSASTSSRSRSASAATNSSSTSDSTRRSSSRGGRTSSARGSSRGGRSSSTTGSSTGRGTSTASSLSDLPSTGRTMLNGDRQTPTPLPVQRASSATVAAAVGRRSAQRRGGGGRRQKTRVQMRIEKRFRRMTRTNKQFAFHGY